MENKLGKNLTRALALVFAVVALLATCMATACSCGTYRKSTFNYNHIAFRPSDLTAFNAAADKARSQLHASSPNPNAVAMALNQMAEELDKLMGDYSYINVEYSKNTEGQFKQYYIDYSDYYAQAQKTYFDVLYEALENPSCSAIFSQWSEADKKTVRERHNMMTGDYVTIQNEITRLETEYRSLTAAYSQEYAYAVEDILLDLVKQYIRLGEKTSYGNYPESAYADFGRTYEISEATALCNAVKTYIAPVIDDVYASITEREQTEIAMANSASLYPDEITRNRGYIERHASDVGSYMREAYGYLNECNLHYAATPTNNPNGVDGAFTTYLYKQEAPYIYQYCTGGYSDLMTFVHEFGHFTSFYINDANGGAELDVAEIQSQANEMLFMPYLSEIYGAAAGKAITKYELFNSLYWSVIMGCLLDEFQREIYASPASYEEDGTITALFERLLGEYGADAYGNAIGESNGIEFKYWWARVSHTITSPFYYISYAVSALPALVIFEDSQTAGRAKAIEEYNYIQENGDGSEGFSTLLAHAGVDSPFSSSTVRDLAEFLKRYVAA